MSKSNSYNPYQDTYIYYSDGRKELIKGEKSNLGICKKCNKEVLKIDLMYHNRLKSLVCDDFFSKYKLLTREERKQEILLEKKEKEDAKLRLLKEREAYKKNSEIRTENLLKSIEIYKSLTGEEREQLEKLIPDEYDPNKDFLYYYNLMKNSKEIEE